MLTKVQLRRTTAALWTSTDPVLAAGEPGVEADTGKVKIGDGASAWSGLDYLSEVDVDALTLAGLADVADTAPTTGADLVWSGTQWVSVAQTQSIVAHGATPGGLVDCRAAIVAAIAAAADDAGGGVVTIPKGAWLVDTDGGTIDVPEGVAVVGLGGYQVRTPSTALNGPTLHIVGTTNSPFTTNRGSRLADFSVYYPDQPINTNTPTAYPFFVTSGVSGNGKSEIANLYFLNCYRGFLVSGANTIDRVRGMFFRTFVRQENSASQTHVTNCGVSGVFSPGTSTLSQQFAGANLRIFEIDGGSDGLTVSTMSVFRALTFVEHTNTGAHAAPALNFGRFTSVLLDGVLRGYHATGGYSLSQQWDNCYFSLRNPDDATIGAVAFDFAAAGQAGVTGKAAQFANCRFRNGSGEVIKVHNLANALDLLVVTDCTFFDWNNDTDNVTAEQAAVRCDLATCDVQLTGNTFHAVDNLPLTAAVVLSAFKRAVVVGNASRACNDGFLFGNGTTLTFVANTTEGSVGKGANITGAVTTVIWGPNNLDIGPTTPVGKVGFYGAAPVAQQTLPAAGVVTAADIRTALINLGLVA